VGQVFTQVKAYITDKGINLADVLPLITVLEIACEDPKGMATPEQKVGELKQMNCAFSTYFTEFQDYATAVQCNDATECTALMRGLNNEIQDALTLSDHIPQQLQEFVASLQRLDN
jgi:hypothetical protein